MVVFHMKFLDRLEEHRRQLRIIHRQEPVSTFRDKLRVDRLDFLGNHTNLAVLGLARVIPVVIHATQGFEVVQGALQRSNVLLETFV